MPLFALGAKFKHYNNRCRIEFGQFKLFKHIDILHDRVAHGSGPHLGQLVQPLLLHVHHT